MIIPSAVEEVLQANRPGLRLGVAGTVLIAVCALAAVGCASKEAGVTAAAGAGGHPAADTSASQAPTPQQEAAKQKAIQEGPAIEAALRQQQGH